MKAGRIILLILGCLMVVMGIIWALQGLNIIKYGNVMVGHMRWVLIGGVVALAGAGVILVSRRRPS